MTKDEGSDTIMGENFSVSFSALNGVVNNEGENARILSNAYASVSGVKSGLSGSIKGQAGINDSLRAILERLETQRGDMNELKNALSGIRNTYIRTENLVSGSRVEKMPTVEDWKNALQVIGSGIGLSVMNPGLGLAYMFGTILAQGETSTDSSFAKMEHELKDFDKLQKKLRDDQYERKDGKWVKVEKDDDDDKDKDKDKKKASALLNDITIASGEIKREGSLLEWQMSQEGEYGSYGYDVKAMSAEASAGWALTAGAVSATAGVAISAFSAEAEGQLGSDMLGVHGKAGVEVLSAEAKANAQFGWLDENGNFDLAAEAGASAEAVLAKAEGTIGADVLGTQVDVTGDIGVGVGAHAKVGYNDGKITADIGAYVGVGGSVKLEIDVSGTIEKFDEVVTCVSDAASAVGDFAADAYDAAADAVGGFVDDIGEGISDAVDWFKKPSWPW
ncbi:MAG: hypothetical protein Q4B72_05880 [Lachnospiraceae bacterium]|nr:hypothetical protein [Lachnospiraceae bacterium]